MADGYAIVTNSEQYDARGFAKALGALTTPGGQLSARGGVRPGGCIVTVNGSLVASVTPGTGAISDGTDADGSWLFALPSTVTKQLSAAPATGTSRIDLLVARIYDADVPAVTSGTKRELDVEIVTGTAAASPTAPAKPAGSTILATVTVPSTGTPVVAPGPLTVAAGGVLPIGSKAERDALPLLYPGLTIFRTDLGVEQTYSGSAWSSPAITQSGTVNVVFSSALAAFAAVVFPKPYAAGTIPDVVAVCASGTTFFASISSVSNTAFNLWLRQYNGVTTTATETASWFARGVLE